MKVIFKYGIGAFAGTVDLATYYATVNKTGSIMRRWVKPKATAQNTEIGGTAKNLATIFNEAAALWKADMISYSNLYKQQHPNPEDPFYVPAGSYAWFTKMMWTFADENSGSVDLKTITLNDITTLFPELISVASAIEYGFLPSVTGGDLLVAEMA